MPFIAKIQLWLVSFWINFLNFVLKIIQNILFYKKLKNPQKILVYKVGNIGDIVCIIPSLIAIRKNYPNAKITFLTSPGKRGSIGAINFLKNAWYFDNIINYYQEDINNLPKQIFFIKELKKEKFDLFIQLPDDWVRFRTLFRNIIFAKLIGVKYAFGFYLRSSWIFYKTQIRYSPLHSNEVESNLSLLKKNGIIIDKVIFDFPFSEKEINKVENLFDKFNFNKNDLIIALGPGAKFFSKEWPLEKFIELSRNIIKKYNAKFIVIGGNNDIEKGKEIENKIGKDKVFNLAGNLSILETLLLFKKISFLISNDSGPVHLAAAVGLPCVALYTIRSPFGKWFPYGKNHKILYKRFLDCDYKKEECVKKSIETITVGEVEKACDELIKNIKKF